LDAFPTAIRRELDALATAPHRKQLSACEAIFNDWLFDRDWVRPALGPTIPLHCSDEFLTGCRDLAQDYGLNIQTHLAEAKFQVISGLKRYGKTLAGHLDDLHLIGTNFTGAHCVWLDQDDIKLMADRGARVAHNPAANLRLGSGIAPIGALRDHGVVVGIGTDGSACSDNQNMFEAMRTASFISRINSPDPSQWLSAWDVLEMATLGSAQVLGFEEKIGRIAKGLKADIVFLDKTNINYVPLNNVANQIVNCEDSSAVKSVMIDGRLVLKDRKFTRFNYEKLRQQAQAAADRMTIENASAREQAHALEPFVAQHCIGLASEAFHVQRRIEQTL
jgi:guanine deaminase